MLESGVVKKWCVQQREYIIEFVILFQTQIGVSLQSPGDSTKEDTQQIFFYQSTHTKNCWPFS